MEEEELKMTDKISPEYVRISLAASLTLGLKEGLFYRNAKLKALNILLHYEEGCLGRCAFCGLSRLRKEELKAKTFIRVDWPLYPVEEIIERSKMTKHIDRVCISMITHRKAIEDTIYIIKQFKKETDLLISVLISPTLIKEIKPLQEMKEAGVDRIGIAIDAATPDLFDLLRGAGVNGPHHWDHYWKIAVMAVKVFGRFNAGIHLIVGLGETEKEMIETIQKGYGLGLNTHLFSFYPEEGSPMEHHHPPPIDRYRKVQLARWIINQGLGSIEQMRFSKDGSLIDFGMDIKPLIETGEAFMTSGCPGRDGKVSCNRPFGNERPSGPIRNYPFMPEREDIEEIKTQIGILNLEF